MTPRWVRTVAALLAIAGCLAPAAAQQTTASPLRGMVAARAKALQAQQLADQGQLAQALELVQVELDSGGDEEFEGLMAFTQGWIEWRLANQPDVRIEVPTPAGDARALSRTELLERSAESYGLALEAFPQNAQARKNLALVERALGNGASALELLRAGGGTSPGDGPLDPEELQRLLLIGDLERELGKLEEALSTYASAYRGGRSDPVAAQRIVELHASGAAGAPGDLLALCRSAAAAGHLAVAALGVEQILARNAEPRADALAPAALELWARIEARRGTLDADSLRRLPDPERWADPLLAELRAVVLAPAERGEVRAWIETSSRRGALVAALRALAQRREGSGDPGAAAAIRERALELAMPLLHSAELPEDRFAALDLALEQAALFSAHPGLDPAGERFARLENELLHEKNVAYGDQDLEAMERFHTVLGLVYAGRGAWGDDGWRAAPYHLRRAVEASRRLARQQGRPVEHPLPHLTRRLARGLLEVRGDADGAFTAYADAARGYAEAGDTRKAAATLKETLAVAALASAPRRDELAALETDLLARGVVSLPDREDRREVSAPNEDGLTRLHAGRRADLRGMLELRTTPRGSKPQFVLRSGRELVELVCTSRRYDLATFAGSEVQVNGLVLPYEFEGTHPLPARLDVGRIEVVGTPPRDR